MSESQESVAFEQEQGVISEPSHRNGVRFSSTLDFAPTPSSISLASESSYGQPTVPSSDTRSLQSLVSVVIQGQQTAPPSAATSSPSLVSAHGRLATYPRPFTLLDENGIPENIAVSLAYHTPLWREDSSIIHLGSDPFPDNSKYHDNSDVEPDVDPDPIIRAGEISGGIMMLNCKNVKALLTENVDEHVSHYILFTPCGTLLGHDHAIDVKFTRKFTAMIGNTWRYHDAEILNHGAPTFEGGVGKTKTLDMVVKHDRSGLKSMVAELDGWVGAVCEVKKKLLICTQLAKADLQGETDEVSARLRGVKLGKKDEEQGDAATDKENMGQTPANAQKEGNFAAVIEKGKGREPEEALKVEAAAPGNHKFSKIQIMKWKAEGMAQYILKEYPGEMPEDFR